MIDNQHHHHSPEVAQRALAPLKSTIGRKANP